MKKILLALFLLLIPTVVYADIGPKPSITINLKNMKGTNYKIDLLSDCSTKKDEIVSSYSSYKDEPIYKYHEGNLYATTLRDFLLHGDVEGNKSHTHKFTYFGVPNEFKVIIQMSDGTIRVSDVIKKTSFDYKVTLDVDTMTIVGKSNHKVFKFFGLLLLTIIVELLIAMLFKIKDYKVIFITNLITNSLLQLAIMRYLPIMGSMIILVIFELIVFVLEYLVYLKCLRNIEHKKKLAYTFLANLATALLTLII